MEEGNITELIKQPEIEQIEFEYKDKLYKFEIRPLTWAQSGAVESAAIKLDIKGKRKPEAKFDAHVYNTEYMKRAIVTPTIPNSFWLACPDDFGTLLTKHIVNRNVNNDEDEVKN